MALAIPALLLKLAGSKPPTVVMVVNHIGLNLSLTLRTADWALVSPAARPLL